MQYMRRDIENCCDADDVLVLAAVNPMRTGNPWRLPSLRQLRWIGSHGGVVEQRLGVGGSESGIKGSRDI